jgi:hypothetical protein
MEDNVSRPPATDRCGNLRWKGLYIDPDQEAPGGDDHIFWCLKTQLVLGPDGKLAGKFECHAARSCYQAL